MANQLEVLTTSPAVFLPSPLKSWAQTSHQTAVKANQSLENYAPITLDEMKAVELLKRVDTKYILSTRQLFQALEIPYIGSSS